MSRNNEFNRMFNHINGLSIGFSDIFKDWQSPLPSYPPHNIYYSQRREDSESTTSVISTDIAVVEVAVAGFKKDEIFVTQLLGNEISIQGIIQDPEIDNGKYAQTQYHSGIGARWFVKRIRFTDYYEIEDVVLSDGILTLTFARNVPEEAKPKKITVR